MKNFWNEEIMDIPVCRDISQNWQSIRDEALAYLDTPHPYSRDKSPTIPYPIYRVPTIDNPEATERLYEGQWGIAPLGVKRSKDTNHKSSSNIFGASEKFLEKYTKWKSGKTIDENLEYASTKFMFFHELLQKHDEGCLMSASLSLLTPGTIIKPHFGGDHFIRCHLCLVNDEACSITVNGETQKWENGKITAFEDRLRHSVEHLGTQDRLILIFDISIEYAKRYIKDAEFQSLVS